MFGQNEIVGRAYFKNQIPNTLKVTSRFFTLQGEGPYRGHPAYFVRLTKCNLACSFCDTFFDQGDDLTYDQILDRAKQDIEGYYAERNLPVQKNILLVISGGEPTLQTNLTEFLDKSKSLFYKAQIESNGILLLDYADDYLTYVVSPKCIEKNNVAIKYLAPNEDVLSRATCLKFVMGIPGTTQFSPYSEVPQWALDWREKTGREIFVSPMNIYRQEPQKSKDLRARNKEITLDERSTVDEVISFWEEGLLDMKANQLNHEYAARYCMDHGCTLNLQIHLYASLA